MLFSGCDDDSLNPCIIGNNRVVTDEVVGLPDFTGVYSETSVEVFIERGNFFEVLISGEENIVDEIEFRVREGELIIENRRRNCLSPRRPIEIYITMPILESVVLAGSGNIRSDDFFDSEVFRVDLIGSGSIFLSGTAQALDALLAGSGNLFLDFDAAEIKLALIGSGNFTVSGRTEVLDILLSGSGNIFAFDCLAEAGYVTISGSGNCDVLITSFLEVLISGSGNVRYRGYPDIDATISGSGSVINVN